MSEESGQTTAGRAAIAFDEHARGPMSGITVIDLSRLVAGNMLSLQLADFGADVIKIEPLEGDPLRAWVNDGKPLFWKSYARNKRSVALNLRVDAAKQALLRLVERADVFIENYRPGTLEKMGLAPDKLLAVNPDLIIVRISGFGQTGPYSSWTGFGTVVEAMSGFAARTGFADREPVLPPLALADMIAGLQGASATMMALWARKTGEARGQVIDLSLLEPIFSMLGPDAAIYRETGHVKQRVGSGSNTSAPRNVYECADGKFVALSASTQTMAFRFFDTIGRSDMKDDPRFAVNAARIENRAAVDEIAGGWFKEQRRDEALKIMRDAGVTVGPVYNIDDAMLDPHFIEREIIVEVEDEDIGTMPTHNHTPRLSATPGVWRYPAPRLGEHTDEVLNGLGFDDAFMANLRENKGTL